MERTSLISYALGFQKQLHLDHDDLNKMTVYDILQRFKQAKIPVPSPSSSLTSTTSSSPSPSPSSSFTSTGADSRQTTLDSRQTSLVAKNEEVMVLCNGIQNGLVVMTNRDQALETMENLHHRISNSRSKLHHQLEWRGRMACDSDFDKNDIESFDECIRRTRSVLQVDIEALAERLKTYKEFVQRRREKDSQALQRGLGDEIFHRDCLQKQEMHAERLAVLEKVVSCPSNTLESQKS